MPVPDFEYRVRTASTFEQIRSGAFEHGEQSPDGILPTAVYQNVVLYGGGGAGKTTIAKRLFAKAFDRGQTPVLIDLKRYREEFPGGADDGAPDDLVERILTAAAIPRLTTSELYQLSGLGDVVVIVDAANEISSSTLRVLISLCRDLRRNWGVRTFWTNRLSPIEDLLPEPLHAEVQKVPGSVVAARLDEKFGEGHYKGLAPRLQKILQRPFFLDLSLRSAQRFSGDRLWSDVFRSFFRLHRSLTDEELRGLARATLDRLKAGESVEGLRSSVGAKTWEALVAADVPVIGASGDFEHHLWRDYLVSLAVAMDPGCWSPVVFDAATSNGRAVEALSMAVEQLPDAASKARFILRVYDWNWGAALECASVGGESDEPARRVPGAMRSAIAAVVAEKRFDAVERTRTRAARILAQYPFAAPFLAAKTRAHVVGALCDVDFAATSSVWPAAEAWKEVYCSSDGVAARDSMIEDIESNDSLLGWTVANFVRRAAVSHAQLARLTEIYERRRLPDEGGIRWRVVHAVGTSATEDVVKLLQKGLGDEYPWVVYGSVRSLMELASKTKGDLRVRSLAAVRGMVESGGGGRARSEILREIVEVCFIRGAVEGWPVACRDLVEAVRKSVRGEDRGAVSRRIDEFLSPKADVSPAPIGPSDLPARPRDGRWLHGLARRLLAWGTRH